MVQGIFRIQAAAQFGDAGPVGALTLGELEHVACHCFQGLAVLALGVNFAQLDVDGNPCGVVANRLFQNLFRLQVAAIGQVDVGFCNRVHIAASIQLAGRVGHGRAARGHFAVGGVDALTTAGAEERVRLNAAFHEGTVYAASATAALHDTVSAITDQQSQQAATGQWNHGVFHQPIKEAGLFDGWWRRHDHLGCGRCRCRCLGGRCRRSGIRSGRSIRRGAGRFGWHLGCRSRCLRGCRGGGNAGHFCLDRRRRTGRWGGGWSRACSRGCADLVQVADVLGQLSHTGVGLAGLLVFRQLVFSSLLALERTLREGQLVWGSCCGLAVFHLGLHLATGRALGRGHCCARCGISQLAAEGVEVAALGCQDLASLGVGHRLGGGFIRNLQHRAGAYAVHVTLDECIGVGAHQGHQHLVQRNICRAVGIRNPTGRVAGLDGHAVGGGGARCCRCTHGGCGWSRYTRRGGALLCHGWRSDLGRCCGCRWGTAQCRWVKQQGVAANNLACAPGGVQDQIEKRIVDRAVAGYPQHGAAIRTALQLDLQGVHQRIELHALGAEHLGRCRGGTQGLSFRRSDLGYVDLGAQRLTQR